MVSTGLRARERLLRDEGDLAPEQSASRLRRPCARDRGPRKRGSRRDREARRQQLRDGAADHRFAGAGFADEAEHLARREREARCRAAPARRAHRESRLDREIRGREDARGHSSLRLQQARTSSVRRSPSPSRLKPSTVTKIARIGSRRIPAGDLVDVSGAHRRSSGPRPADSRRRSCRRTTGSPRRSPRCPSRG